MLRNWCIIVDFISSHAIEIYNNFYTSCYIILLTLEVFILLCFPLLKVYWCAFWMLTLFNLYNFLMIQLEQKKISPAKWPKTCKMKIEFWFTEIKYNPITPKKSLRLCPILKLWSRKCQPENYTVNLKIMNQKMLNQSLTRATPYQQNYPLDTLRYIYI